ncbi:MAG: hypothetical protein WCR72_16595 [Bacteroidota bacterium]
MNIRLLQGDKTIAISACSAPEVIPNNFSFLRGNLTSCTLTSSFINSPCQTGFEFHTAEFPDCITFKSNKQTSIQNFAHDEVQAGLTPSALTPAKAFYILRAGVNNLLIS